MVRICNKEWLGNMHWKLSFIRPDLYFPFVFANLLLHHGQIGSCRLVCKPHSIAPSTIGSHRRVVITAKKVNLALVFIKQLNNQFQTGVGFHLARRAGVVLVAIMRRHIDIWISLFEWATIVTHLAFYSINQWLASMVPKHQRMTGWQIVCVARPFLLPSRVTGPIDFGESW